MIGIIVGLRAGLPFSSYLWFLPCLFVAESLLYPFVRKGRKEYGFTEREMFLSEKPLMLVRDLIDDDFNSVLFKGKSAFWG
ncbi:hypothetical protein [Parabacteroides distasonis]|uniref:hypothetical protein n=1 Tax=Parabacteroides distasonis TaxID=823 RepID=UPI00111F5DA7|nr:hypothetical protein [Parabacteroides distasonis]